CGWYWGPMNWEDAEMKLKGKPDGSFLVRDSSDPRYILSLSFRSQGVTHHTRMEHYRGLPPTPVQLLYPVSRFSNVKSLQHLCRFCIRQIVRIDHIQELPLPRYTGPFGSETVSLVDVDISRRGTNTPHPPTPPAPPRRSLSLLDDIAGPQPGPFIVSVMGASLQSLPLPLPPPPLPSHATIQHSLSLN
ncbi:unnamed protein product, partial [Menidia menidia]